MSGVWGQGSQGNLGQTTWVSCPILLPVIPGVAHVTPGVQGGGVVYQPRAATRELHEAKYRVFLDMGDHQRTYRSVCPSIYWIIS